MVEKDTAPQPGVRVPARNKESAIKGQSAGRSRSAHESRVTNAFRLSGIVALNAQRQESIPSTPEAAYVSAPDAEKLGADHPLLGLDTFEALAMDQKIQRHQRERSTVDHQHHWR